MVAALCVASMGLQASACTPSASLQAGKRFMGQTRALHRPCQQNRRAAPGRFVPQANELNKWADRGGMDDDCEFHDGTFDRETAHVVLRVLTAKATQRLLYQLQELNVHKAQWFNNYCSEHSPSEGNKFLLDLFKEQPVVVNDVSTNTQHKIDPANLAHRVIQIRTEMANSLWPTGTGQRPVGFPKYMEVENTLLMRTHLERSTYISGGSEKGYAGRRGYNRRR